MASTMVLGPSEWKDPNPSFFPTDIVEQPLEVRRRIAAQLRVYGVSAVLMEDNPSKVGETHTELFTRTIREHDVQAFLVYWPRGAKILGLEKEFGDLLRWLAEGTIQPGQVFLLVDRGMLRDSEDGTSVCSEPGNRTRYHEDFSSYEVKFRPWDSWYALWRQLEAIAMEVADLRSVPWHDALALRPSMMSTGKDAWRDVSRVLAALHAIGLKVPLPILQNLLPHLLERSLREAAQKEGFRLIEDADGVTLVVASKKQQKAASRDLDVATLQTILLQVIARANPNIHARFVAKLLARSQAAVADLQGWQLLQEAATGRFPGHPIYLHMRAMQARKAWIDARDQGPAREADAKLQEARNLLEEAHRAAPTDEAVLQSQGFLEEEAGNVGNVFTQGSARWHYHQATIQGKQPHAYVAWARLEEKEARRTGKADLLGDKDLPRPYSARWLYREAYWQFGPHPPLLTSWAMLEGAERNLGDFYEPFTARWIYSQLIAARSTAAAWRNWAILEKEDEQRNGGIKSLEEIFSARSMFRTAHHEVCPEDAAILDAWARLEKDDENYGSPDKIAEETAWGLFQRASQLNPDMPHPLEGLAKLSAKTRQPAGDPVDPKPKTTRWWFREALEAAKAWGDVPMGPMIVAGSWMEFELRRLKSYHSSNRATVVDVMEAVYKDLMSTYPDLPRGQSARNHLLLGRLAVAEPDLKKAIKQFQKAIKFKPDYLEAQGHLAHACIEASSRYPTAASHYKKLAERHVEIARELDLPMNRDDARITPLLAIREKVYAAS